MAKEWFILIDGEREGPFDLEELKEDRRLNPDTLVWKEGFVNWRPVKEVSELDDLFEEEEPKETAAPAKPQFAEELPPDDGVLVAQNNSPNPYLWVILALALLVFILTRLYL